MDIITALLITFLLALVAGIHIRHFGNRGKRIGHTNLALGICMLAALVWCGTTQPTSNEYGTVYGNGLFGSVQYTGQSETYYLFDSTGFMSCTELAVPRGNVDLPAMTKLYPTVVLWYDSPHLYVSNQTVTIGDTEYMRCEGVTRIRPNYTDIQILLAVASLTLLLFCDGIALVLWLVRKIRKQPTGDET